MKGDLLNTGRVDRAVLEGLLRPPPGLLPRLRYYGRRYGYLHAICSYIGRKHFWLWKLFGPALTRPYIRRWLNSPGPRILNLGGGNVLSERWLTADVDPRSDVYVDVTRPFPFPTMSVDVVYSEEVIEHISLEQGRNMLRECLRILKPGGILRLTTPSLDYFVRHALAATEGSTQINDIFYLHGHRRIYLESDMRGLLEEVGFVDLKRSCYRDPDSSCGHFDTHAARFAFAPPECSQYWDARRLGL